MSIHVAVIGCGGMGRSHLNGYKADPRAHIVGVADQSEEAARKAATDYNVPFYTTDINALLDRPGLQAVSVVTPNHTHIDVTPKVAARGIHALCEKPLALSVEDARRMIDAASRGKAILAVGHVLRFAPPIAEVHRMARSGELGRVVNFYVLRMGTASAFLALSWGRERRTLGGLVRTLNCHEIDVLRWIAGEITHVRAEMAHLMVEGIDYEDVAWMAFTFEGGALGLIGQNLVHYLGNHYYEIMGTEATVRFRTSGPITVAGKDRKATERPTSDRVAVHEQIRCFLDSVEAGRVVAPLADGVEGLKGLAIIDAAYRSAETGMKERVVW
ncbi:MAG: hypothetical protein A3F84_03165 [Candidatus Handelsmanbacteria bacterium RIFCSPLOWO2_12_FULL_64_10]|uniref:Oxidoreductase n=1 Tax=Handelsmanbacteria sp. (strain RIFCSPLOWO2_12_FULL_64_10) TaxID=1817868 RepID=A0A1F6C761_HANXR|nr:MAG: hypothetical protein A3F84_03165 [Candidatus Handelsmanbacteria bacterium RIFCSPLOWO2_12_FULL_64_10]